MPARAIGNFILARAHKVGLHTKQAIVDAVDSSRQPIFDLLGAVTVEQANRKHYGISENVAAAMRFRDWDSLVSAWIDDDLERGLASPPVRRRVGTKRDL